MQKKLRETFDPVISDKFTAEQAIDSFGLNYCKVSPVLQDDKALAVKAVKKDPYAVIFMNDRMRQDPEIKQEVMKRRSYLEKYLDPMKATQMMSAENRDQIDLSTLIIRKENAKAYEIQQRIALMPGAR